jgi:aconitate decarboxylase
MSTITQDLIHNVLDTRFENFSEEDIQDGKNQIIDIVAVILSGANAAGNSILLDLIRQWGGSREATILPHGDKVPLPHAAMMNSIAARSFDHEVTGPAPTGENEGRLAGHVPSTTGPTALAISEYLNSSGKDLISAVVLGGDLGARIAVASDDNRDGFDLVGTANPFGATAVAGRLMGLTENQMINAFGIVVNQLAGSFGAIWDGVESFKLIGAMAARNGIISAILAQKGFTGIKDPLLGPRGYFRLYTKNYYPDYLTRDLGKSFYCKGEHKKYPSCYGNHNMIECALEIIRQHNINADDIDEIIVGVSPNKITSWLNLPFDKVDSQPRALFNYQYGAANVFLRKSAKLEHYTEEFIRDPKVVALANRVKVEPNQQKIRAIELKVKMRDGQEFSEVYKQKEMRGYPSNPLTKEELKEKYWANVEFSKTVSKQSAQKALDMIENLEMIDDVSEIIKLLVASPVK